MVSSFLSRLAYRTGGTNCVRCFELTLRSLNVVQIHTEGFDKCYTTEEAAMATCPTNESIASGKSREIMLYSEYSRSFFFYFFFSPLLLFLLPLLLLNLKKIKPFVFVVFRNERIERRCSDRTGILSGQWPLRFHLFCQRRIV